MNEREIIVQQEIAPIDNAVTNGNQPQPVEKQSKKAAVFLKRFALFLIFGNNVQLKSKTRYIAFMAVLAALAIAIKPLTYDTGSFKLTFTYIPCFIAGIYFGPLFAAGLGVAVSYSQFLFVGYLPWTLNVVGQALMGFIMSIFVQGIKTKKLSVNTKIIFGAVVVCFAVTLGINTVAFMIEPFSPNYGWTYWQVSFFTAPPRALLQPLVLAINTLLTIYIVKGLDRAYFKNNINHYANKKAANQNIKEYDTPLAAQKPDDG